MSDERNTDTFQIVGFDQGGEQVSRNGIVHRLVCHIEGGEKIAIWGKKENRDNIKAVLNAGLPCTVECNTIPPKEEWRTRHGHTHWVPEDFSLRVL